MENEEGPRGFKIDFSEEEPETPPEKSSAQRERKAPARPGRPAVRPAFLWLLTLFAAGGLLYFGYHQIDRRIQAIEASGESEVQDLSGKIDERMDAISRMLSNQNEQIRNRVRELEKQVKKNTETADNLQKLLSQAQLDIAEVQTRFKKRLGEISAEMGKTASGIKENSNRLTDMENTIRQVKSVTSDIEQIRQERGKITDRLDQLSGRINSLEKNQLDSEAVESRLKEMRRSNNQEFETRMQEMQKRIKALNDRRGLR